MYIPDSSNGIDEDVREDRDSDILPLLRRLIAGNLKPGEGEHLVNAAIRRTLHILYWVSARRSYRLQLLGLEMEDIAYDMIAELFAAEEEECCHRLRRSLIAMGSLTSDDELLSAYEAILFRNVHQQYARLFAEIDPLHLHLSRGLKAHILRDHSIQVLATFDGRCFYRGSTDDARLHLPAMPYEKLRQHIRYNPDESRSSVIGVLNSVLEALERQDQYRRAVLETDVLQIAKDIVGMDMRGNYVQHAEQEERHDSRLLMHILYKSLDECGPWLENTYIRTHRLTELELKLFIDAIRLYFTDIMRGDESQGAYAYLRKCMPGLTHTRFRDSYRRRFEYILQHVMETARAHLSREESYLR